MGKKNLLVLNNDMYEGTIARGLRLASIPEAQGGWSEYFAKSNDVDLRIEDDTLRAQTALMLENAKNWMARVCRARPNAHGVVKIDEATRAALVGGYSDYLFPVIRAAFPTNAVNDLVSVQPTTRRVSTIVFWNWIVGTSKGSYGQGQRLFDANTGKQDIGFNFSNEVIDREVVGTGDGSTTALTGTLKFNDGGGVRPGSVAITYLNSSTGVVIYDNGNGGWTGSVAGAINYKTGVFSITAGTAPDNATDITATYRYDSEGSRLTPEVDVQITTSTVETERRALKLNYSQESMYDVMQEFGVQLEPQLVSGCAEQINYEIGRQLVHEMWEVAVSVATFPLTQPNPSQYTQQDHFRDLAYKLNLASNIIQRKTQKAYGNFIIVDEGASNLIESLPAGMFESAPRPANVQGLHFIGTLLKKYRVYKDMYLNKEAGASSYGNMLMGYKGTDWFAAGLVWSPYQLMYTTDTLTTADFMSQKGMASRYATKMVNPNMYVRIDLSA